MAQRQGSSPSGTMHDTVETTALSERVAASNTTSTAIGGKVCCACGKNVAGQKRFKDAEGRYWCYDCGVEDHIRKHPEDGIACAECGGKFAPSQLTEYEDDDVYCEPCVTKKRAQKKREEARIAAAAEEARLQEKHRKMLLAGAAAVAVVAIALAVWSVAF